MTSGKSGNSVRRNFGSSSTKIGLLRGINVGGKNRIKMAELRKSLEARNLANVETYIQSGNLVFDSKRKVEGLSRTISEIMKEDFDVTAPCLVFCNKTLEKIVGHQPFQDVEVSQLHVTILGRVPGQSEYRRLDDVVLGDDRYSFHGNVVYLALPNGYSRTKLNNGFFEKQFETTATTRNWKTVLKLREIVEARRR